MSVKLTGKVTKATKLKFDAEAVEAFYETLSKEQFLINAWVLPSSELPDYDRPKVKDVWEVFSEIDGKRLQKKKRQHFCFLLISICLETQEARAKDKKIGQFTKDLYPKLDSIFEKVWNINEGKLDFTTFFVFQKPTRPSVWTFENSFRKLDKMKVQTFFF